jgi:hypothetical protein
MTALNFPADPDDQDEYDNYIYNASKDVWERKAISAAFIAKFFVSDTAPASAENGDVWFDSETGASYMYYQDVDDFQWVQFGVGRQGPQGPAGPTGPTGTIGGTEDFSPKYYIENIRTGEYTLALSDVNKVVAMNNSSAANVIIPTNATVAFPIGTVINIYSMTANAVGIVGASGVTVRNGGTIVQQYTEISVRKRGTNEWVLSGNVV